MNLPCEIIVADVIPRMRALLARELISRGHSQVATARMLGITQPAVSQYLKKARSKRVAALETEELKGKIKGIADRVVKHNNANVELCKLCRYLRKRGSFCALHRKKEKVPSSCRMCMGDEM